MIRRGFSFRTMLGDFMTRPDLVGDRVARGDRYTVGDFRVVLALLLPRGVFRDDGGAIDICD
jgi:hypothetical protein